MDPFIEQAFKASCVISILMYKTISKSLQKCYLAHLFIHLWCIFALTVMCMENIIYISNFCAIIWRNWHISNIDLKGVWIYDIHALTLGAWLKNLHITMVVLCTVTLYDLKPMIKCKNIANDTKIATLALLELTFAF